MCRRLIHQPRLSSLTGSVTVPSFLSTYLTVGIPVVPRASQPPVPASSAPSLFDSSLVPSTSSPTLAPSVGKAFVVSSGYAPIPGKLVAKITMVNTVLKYSLSRSFNMALSLANCALKENACTAGYPSGEKRRRC